MAGACRETARCAMTGRVGYERCSTSSTGSTIFVCTATPFFFAGANCHCETADTRLRVRFWSLPCTRMSEGWPLSSTVMLSVTVEPSWRRERPVGETIFSRTGASKATALATLAWEEAVVAKAEEDRTPPRTMAERARIFLEFMRGKPRGTREVSGFVFLFGKRREIFPAACQVLLQCA